MPRIFVQDTFYYPVQHARIYETDYEEILIRQSPALFPAFHVVKYRDLVETDYGSAKPPLALIDRKFREWWLVNLEVSEPSFKHVERVVATIRARRFGKADAQLLSQRNTDLDPDATFEMIKQAQPRAFILINGTVPPWAGSISPLDGLVGVVEVFESKEGKRALRVNGQHPMPPPEIVVRCKRDPVVRSMLIVERAELLAPWSSGAQEIMVGETVIEWTLVVDGAVARIAPSGRSPLPVGVTDFVITRGDDGLMHLDPDLKASAKGGS